MKKNFLKLKMVAAFATALFFACGGIANADTFNGLGDGSSWEDANNWLLDAVPLNNGSGNTFINGGHDVDFDAATWAALDAADNLQSPTQYRVVRFLLNENTGEGAIGANSITFDHGAGNTVLQTNGTSSIFGGRSGSDTVINVLSGIVNTGSRDQYGARAGAMGTLNVDGGDYVVGRSNLLLGVGTDTVTDSGTGIANITSGSFLTREGVGIGSTSEFNVIGSGASSIGVGSNGVNGFWQQNADAVLGVALDGSGVTDVLVNSVDGGGGVATFESGSILDPTDLGGWTPNVWETVLFADNGIVDNGLALSASSVAAGWESRIINGNELQVQLVAIPEPSSMALIGLGGVFFAARRRKLA